jgi:hypothetical protein
VRRLAVALAVVVGCLTVAAPALAVEPRSPYEVETIEAALRATGGVVDASPNGKSIEEIVVRPLDVLEDRDPLPTFAIDFLNFFHVTSQPEILRQLLLVKAGDPYNQAFVDESARRLRNIRQLSLVLTLPLVGSTPDRVKLLVITKDIWSLRLNSDFRASSSGLEYLLLQPAEENVAGLQQTASLRFELEPATYTFGVGYKVPRVGGSEIAATVSTNLIVNRESGDLEGVVGGLYYGQPLTNTRLEWSWVGSMTFQKRVTRFFQGLDPLTFDAPSTPEDDAIPIEYDVDSLAGRIAFIRSFGVDVKHDILFGVEATRNVFRPRGLDGRSAEVQREFVDAEVPQSDRRLYPYVGYSTYSNIFQSVLNVETLGLQENFRSGHDAFVKVYPVLEQLASSRSFVGVNAGVALTTPLGDGLGRLAAQGTIEASPEQVFDSNLSVSARFVSPSTPVGRLHFDSVWFQRFENFLNRQSVLGGESRLRGYPSGAYRGANVMAYNLELRSRPAELWTVQLGAAAFYDTGAVWDEGETPDFVQDVGVGLRLVFPQLERTGMRFDWAVPLQLDPSVGVTSIFPGRFLVTFDQAFGFPGVAIPNVAL